MRTLLLLRHAKSSWDDDSLDDHDRPLAPRGERGAAVIGRYLTQQDLVPDLVLCSTALRARRTLEALRPLVAGLPEPVLEPELYEASAGALLDRVRALPDSARRTLLVAHEPALSALALRLAGRSDDKEAGRRLARKFPTGGLAILGFAADTWPEVGPAAGRLLGFVTPKSLV